MKSDIRGKRKKKNSRFKSLSNIFTSYHVKRLFPSESRNFSAPPQIYLINKTLRNNLAGKLEIIPGGRHLAMCVCVYNY